MHSGWPVLCLAAGGALLAQQLTLDEAISTALRENRQLRTAALEVQKYDDRLAAARTRRLPQISWYALGAQRVTELSFRFDRGVFGDFPGIGPVPAQDTSIRAPRRLSALLIGQVSQPLSQQYKIGLGLRQLSLGREIARESERAQRQAIANEVKRTYYGILQAESALAAIEESIRLYRELDRVTEQYVLQQVALKSDSLEIKSRLARAEYDALTVSNPLATAKEHLNELMGRDLATEFRVVRVEDASWTEIDLDAARRLALERRPEIRRARLQASQAAFDRRLQKADYIPDLSLSFNYLSPLNFGTIIPATIASVGLQLQWEPFDWGRRKHELAEKSRTTAQARLALREAENQIAIDVNMKFRKLQEARQLLTVARLGRETAQEKLRITGNRYRQEAALLKDVLQLQAMLADANNQYSQALLGFWTAKADFDKALGEEQ